MSGVMHIAVTTGISRIDREMNGRQQTREDSGRTRKGL
jgi:hypothetical protein